MKEPWTRDFDEILKELDSIISRNISLQNNKGVLTPVKVCKIIEHRQRLYILTKRPPDLDSVSDIKSAYYKLKGKPILGFPCMVERESDRLLALPFPDEMFQLQLRKSPRYHTPKEAIMSFLITNKRRVNICMLQNISLSGAKLFGIPHYDLMENDIIGPATLTLSASDAPIARGITLQNAIIERVVPIRGGKFELGISFDLSKKDK